MVVVVVFIVIEICKGFVYVYEFWDLSGVDFYIVYCDMLLLNVFVMKYGEVKIVDFGFVKVNL